MNSRPKKSAGAFSAPAASPRPLPAASPIRAPACSRPSPRAIPASPASPRAFPARASSTATTPCSPIRRSTRSTSRRRIPATPNGRSRRRKPASMCFAKSRLALTAFEADAMIHAARKAGTFLGEAFMYRLHPQTQKLVELIKSGAIGEVRMIKSSFGFAMPGFMPEHRLYANDLAGGGILDVGGYPVSMARLIAGAAVGKALRRAGQSGRRRASRPVRRRRMGLGAAALSGRHRRRSLLQHLARPGQCAAHPSARRAASRCRTSGSPAAIAMSARAGSTSSIPTDRRETISVNETRHLYSFEVDAAGEAILAGRQEFAWPGMGWADSLGNLRVLDKWRAAVGLEYGIEKADAQVQHDFRPAAAARRRQRSASAPIPGLAKPASVLALGFEDFRTFSSGSILLDAFFEAGGNLFDTAYVYGARLYREAARRMAGKPRRARAIGDHRQGRAHAALLSRHDRQAA